MNKPTWAVNLKKARKAFKLTQKEVADRIYRSQQAYAGYESGEAQPDIDTWHKLCDLYRIVDLLRFLSDDNYFEKLAA